LHLSPAPDSLPPLDRSDRPGQHLDLTQRRLRLVPPLGGQLALTFPESPDPRLPAPHALARALVQRLLETAAGVRPVHQLRPHTSPTLYARLERQLTGRRFTGRRPTLADVRSLHVQQQSATVAEVCATVTRQLGSARRLTALALRLEDEHGRWVCTDLAGL
jgi:hypothetical protein